MTWRAMPARPYPEVMTDDQALQSASDFVGEAVVFSIAGWLVWWENNRSAQKDAAGPDHPRSPRHPSHSVTVLAVSSTTWWWEHYRSVQSDVA